MQLGKFVKIEVHAEQYLQKVGNSFDYLLEVAPADIPLSEVLGDWITGVWQPHFLAWQHPHLQTYLFRASVYLGPYTVSTDDGPSLRMRYDDVFEFASNISGQGSGKPLPTYAAVTAKKTTGGTPRELFSSGTMLDGSVDSRFRGGMRIGGITEEMTQDGQGNKLATVTGANWLNTWQMSANKLLRPSFQFGTFGGEYTLQLYVFSKRAAGNVIRMSGGNPTVKLRRCSSLPVSQFLGSQVSRKQVQQFQ